MEMTSEKAIHRIKLYDGYHGGPIWRSPNNNSIYYNSEIDKQLRVPLASRDEILTELGF